ncbi:ankyrin repeat-containing domain protein [Aspergillus tamarii]|uniref:Ankyrin repeat-containing domain protein n=1 Tax=Aspergillus tamarii TaxID=41984 RepID=A0A5N6UU83_ASPTM|nr:ankyrin repeat-containing domain protein [Aspergillus tamarii]
MLDPGGFALEPALVEAASRNHSSVIARILNHCPSTPLTCALRIACMTGSLMACQELINRQLPHNLDHLLYLACLRGHASVVRFLVDTAKSEKKAIFLTRLETQLQSTLDDNIKSLLLDVHGHLSMPQSDADLLSASYEGNGNEVKRLCQLGSSPNTEDIFGATPLLIAVREGNAEIARILLDYGAPVGARHTKFHAFSPSIHYSDYTLVDIALLMVVKRRSPRATQSYMEIINVLLQAGAPIRFSIFYTVANNYPGMLCYLMKCGLPTESINVKSLRASTALHTAAKDGFDEIIQLLLDAGAKISVDAYGWTPIDVAIEFSRMKVVKLFESRNIEAHRSKKTVTRHELDNGANASVSICQDCGLIVLRTLSHYCQ